MTEKAVTPVAPLDAAIMEEVLIGGDLSKLTPEQRVIYYKKVCESLELNPLTKPFEYLMLGRGDQKRLVLYIRRDGTEQLREKRGVSVTGLEKRRDGDMYIVTALAQDKTGRTDASTGVVSLAGLRGDDLANAIMKAETKAKRRVTLSICGLGWLDETEVESIADAKPTTVSEEGVIVEGAEDEPSWDLPAERIAELAEAFVEWGVLPQDKTQANHVKNLARLSPFGPALNVKDPTTRRWFEIYRGVREVNPKMKAKQAAQDATEIWDAEGDDAFENFGQTGQ